MAWVVSITVVTLLNDAHLDSPGQGILDDLRKHLRRHRAELYCKLSILRCTDKIYTHGILGSRMDSTVKRNDDFSQLEPALFSICCAVNSLMALRYACA
jgi:hypothetical protein